jgi:hypothetical protein
MIDPELKSVGKAVGVLVAASQSEREEETRDRAERGSVVRGSDQASVAAEQDPRRLTGYDPSAREITSTALGALTPPSISSRSSVAPIFSTALIAPTWPRMQRDARMRSLPWRAGARTSRNPARAYPRRQLHRSSCCRTGTASTRLSRRRAPHRTSRLCARRPHHSE